MENNDSDIGGFIILLVIGIIIALICM